MNNKDKVEQIKELVKDIDRESLVEIISSLVTDEEQDMINTIKTLQELSEKVHYAKLMDIVSALWALDVEKTHGGGLWVYIPVLPIDVPAYQREAYLRVHNSHKAKVKRYLSDMGRVNK